MNQTRKDVLNGWKEIAAYLGRDPRTVERWEKQRSLPVRRLPGSGRATVYALVTELDQWMEGTPAQEPALKAPDTAAAVELPGEAGQRQVPVADAGLDPTAAGDNRPTLRAAKEWRGQWMRWVVALTLLLVVCWLGIRAAVHWRQRAGERPVSAKGQPVRLPRLVPPSPVPGVEELYLRGCYQTELRTPEALHRAQEVFTAALRKDPQYAPAYAGLANTFLLLREYAVLPDEEAYPQAIGAAEKAEKLNPNLPQAHAAMGFVDFFWRWDAAAAEGEFHRALELDPDLALSHHWYGSVLTHEGRFREGLAELSVAQRLDPSSAPILTMRAFALGLSGKRADAMEILQDAASSDGSGQSRNPATMHSVIATLNLLPPRDLSRYLGESLLAAELRQDVQTARTLQMASRVYKARGEQAMWRALLEEEQARHRSGGPTYAMAKYEAELGAREQALNDLAAVYARRDPALIGISVEPSFAGLQREPRFMQIRAAMGLPEAEVN